MASDAEKFEIVAIVQSMLQRLEADRFVILSDAGTPIRYGDLDANVPSRAERLLAILLSGADITGDAHWQQVYLRMREARLPNCRGLGGQPWVLTQNQCAFFLLRRLEKDPQVRKVYEAGSLEAARACVPYLGKVAASVDDKGFVATVMNPQEAAFAIVLTEDPAFIAPHLAAIQRVLVAYDYARSLRGSSLCVAGVRPAECIAWSLARQGLLKPESNRPAVD
jgi:hypothetical protein